MKGHFEIGSVTPTRYFFSIAVVLGLLFAMISTDQEKSLVLVFVQWQLQTVLPVALLIGAHIVLLNSARFTALNPWLGLAISGIAGATLFAPPALAIDLWLNPPTSVVHWPGELFDEWISVMPPVAICWMALNAPWVMGYRLEKGAATENRADARSVASEAPEFMQLLPEEKRGRLVMLKAELHYLQVVTEQGSALILYNLADAIAQLPSEAGFSVHRSYWVARDAIESFARRGRQGELLLRDGQRVPVSRNRLAEVVAGLEPAQPA